MLLPRQVMLAANKVTKRKEVEKCACDLKWKKASLLRSIAGFLERSEFCRTLSVLRTEAKSDLDGYRGGDFDFEEVFAKLFESSVGSFKANIVSHKVQVVSKDANTKRKRKGDDGSHKANNKLDMVDAIGDVECCLGKKLSKEKRCKSPTCELLEPLIARKEKKRKKKPLGFSNEENSELIFMEMIQKEKEIRDHENQYNESQEKTKTKRKRTKLVSGFLEENVELSGHERLHEFVEDKVRYVKSLLQDDSAQLDTKLKREEKKKGNVVLGVDIMDQVGLPNDHPGNFHVKTDCNVSEQCLKNFREDNSFHESESEPQEYEKVNFDVMQHFDGYISGCRRHKFLAVDKRKGGSRATSLEKPNNLLNGERSETNKSKKSKKRKSHNSGVSEHDNMVSHQTSEARNSECSADKETKALQKLDFLILGDGEKELRKRKRKKQKDQGLSYGSSDAHPEVLVKYKENVDKVSRKNDAKKHFPGNVKDETF